MTCQGCLCLLSVQEECKNPREYQKKTGTGVTKYSKTLCDLCDNAEMNRLAKKNGHGQPRRAGDA